MMHVEVGEGRGPYLLLVHGICSSRAQWRPNLAGLSEVCRPVVVELLGHGRSESPDGAEPYRVTSYIERFEAIRESLGVERWAICGQSFGAGLTLSYALAHPERVVGQIFTNSNSALATRHDAAREAQRLARLAGFEERGRAALEAMPFYPNRSGRLAPDVQEELLRDAELISLHGVAQGMRYTSPDLSVADRFGQTRVPTLLVNGRREKTFQPAREAAPRLLPSLQVVDLEGGHPVNLDCPEGFNTAVAEFLGAL
ncbi:MAG TPA: alpha/beta hydrolase [Caulobacteraceae bacterium]|nr:alpha/beta hydrolase [Caulobacteraceae bacterium]